MTPRKDLISDSFSKAAGSYDRAAEVQLRAAEGLARLILDLPLRKEPQVLEIGCGTGFLSRRLLTGLPDARLLLTDIAPGMLDQCRKALYDDPRADFALMDGEHPEDGPWDLIASSLAAQWFADLPTALGRLRACLAPGGRLAIATLGRDTFVEWRALHAELGLACGTPDYPALEQLQALGGELREERVILSFPEGRDFLRSLKEIGAALPRSGYRPLAPGRMRALLDRFQGRVTYHILYAVFGPEGL